MPICPNGHESADAEYCEECGFKIGGPGAAETGSAASATPGASATGGDSTDGPRQCPSCGHTNTGRFCERCGHDFLTASLGGGQPEQGGDSAAGKGTADEGAPNAGGADQGTGGDSTSPDRAAAGSGTDAPGGSAPSAGRRRAAGLVVVADPTYFDKVRSVNGPDADGLRFPTYCPVRRFQLHGEQLVIGRRSRSRGIEPDVDLVGPPEDPGVSHLHAMLVAQPDGGWAVVDLESANGTYLNDSADPIEANTPIPLSDGDHIHLGAWTKLTILIGTA